MMEPGSDRLLPPRVLGEFGPMPLIDVLKDLYAQRKYQVVSLQGPGCTTALRFVRDVADEQGLSIATIDGWWSPTENLAPVMLRVATKCPGRVDATLQLCEWGRDEYIDYLLAYHPAACKHVMAALAHIDIHFAAGSPFLWQPYLEWLATHEDTISPDQFVLNVMEEELDGEPTLSNVADRLLSLNQSETLGLAPSDRIERWLRLDDVKHTLMARRLAEHVRARNRVMLKRRWPSEILKSTARFLQAAALDARDVDRVVDFLQRSTDKSRYSSTAISLLNQLVPGWKPDLQRSTDLSWGDFRGAKWSGCGLRKANLRAAQLSDADLTGADLRESTVHNARFCRAAMSDVQMSRLQGREVSFADANLTRADCSHSNFTEANFARASLRETNFSYCKFDRADMRKTNWHGATCANSYFYGVCLEESLLAGSLFRSSYFKLVSFKGALLPRADFGEATFAAGISLELMDLSGCNFNGAKLQGTYLTDSTASGASFKLADLSRAGMAGVVWENCDLRGADLRGAAFHMGSTRCGLVDSPYPSHGTRTGFYTDDYVDLTYKHPEQVRKAALIGCDLRGALLFGCDFYLVDVRDCQLDPDQRELMASCGAILE